MTTREDFEKWFAENHPLYTENAFTGSVKSGLHTAWQDCAAHYEAEIELLKAELLESIHQSAEKEWLIAEKDKALQFYANYDHMTKIKPWHESDNAAEERKKSGFVHVTTCNDDEEIWVENGTAAEKALSLTHDSVRLVEVATVNSVAKGDVSWLVVSDTVQEPVDVERGTKLYTIVKGAAE